MTEELKVWMVNGEVVRDRYKTDFIEGGHGYVYDFIPENEIWLEEALPDNERPFVLLHERYERDLMKGGMEYNEAHKKAAKMEFAARKKAENESNGLPKPDKHSEPTHDSGKDIALSGEDGRKAESLLATSQRYGVERMAELVSAALSRLIDSPGKLMRATRLLSHEELAELADVFAAVNSTAELLGRSRIRKRQEMAQKVAFSEDVPTDFSCFADAISPLTPKQALDYFRNLIPKLGMDPDRWGALQERHAFTLAAATDGVILEQVKNAIRRSMETEPSVVRGGLQIQRILDLAGMSHRNPQYSEMVYRTNALESYNSGCSRELAEPDVSETFPVWRYANPGDNRSRPTHAARAGKYYPANVPFVEVRGLDIKDAANCRCVLPGQLLQGNILAASESRYSGQAVKLVTRSGASVSVTINHPILTANGLVPAGQIHQGQYLVHHSGEINRLVKVNDEQHAPVIVEDFFKTFSKLDVPRIRKRASAFDLHGDGASVNGEIQIVRTNGDLLFDLQSNGNHRRFKGDFRRSDSQELGLSGGCSGNSTGRAIGSFHSATNLYTNGNKSSGNSIPGNQRTVTERLERFSIPVSFRKISHVKVSDEIVTLANDHAFCYKLGSQSLMFDTGLDTQLAERFASNVPCDERFEIGHALDRGQFNRFNRVSDWHSFGNGPAQSRRANTNFLGKMIKRLSRSVSPYDIFEVGKLWGDSSLRGKHCRLGLASHLDVPLPEFLANGPSSYASFLDQIAQRFTGQVFLDQVVEVIIFHYEGPVYDFQTTVGYYTIGQSESSSIIIGNCTLIPIDKWAWAKLQQQGKRVEETTARFSEEELSVIVVKVPTNPDWPLIEAGAWEAFVEDKNKHEHAGKGTEKGGQFVSKGQGGGGTEKPKEKKAKQPKAQSAAGHKSKEGEGFQDNSMNTAAHPLLNWVAKDKTLSLLTEGIAKIGGGSEIADITHQMTELKPQADILLTAHFEAKKAEDEARKGTDKEAITNAKDVRNKTYDEWKKTVDKLRSLNRDLAQKRKHNLERATSLLSVDKPMSIESSIPFEIAPDHRQSINNALEFVGKITGSSKLAKTKVGFNTCSASPSAMNDISLLNRAHYNDNEKTVYTTDLHGDSVNAHEIGHHLENEIPGAAEACQEFLKHRGVGLNPVKMNDINPGCNYGDHEVGDPDDFGRFFDKNAAAYVGKKYERGSEVLSMGIEAIHRDAAGFAKADPEYFKFVVGVLRGKHQ